MWQYTAKNMELWDRGILNKLLKNTINQKCSHNLRFKNAALCAQYLFDKRNKAKSIHKPTNGLALYTIEEDLPNHII